MITSKLIIDLVEKYFSLSKSAWSGTFTVYENPTQSDYIEMNKVAVDNNRKLQEIRFLVNGKLEKIYVCDGWVGTHENMCKSIGISYNSSLLILGIAKVVSIGEKPKIITMSPNSKSFVDYKWSWLKNYIDFSDVDKKYIDYYHLS